MYKRIKNYQKESKIYVVNMTQKQKAASVRVNLLCVSGIAAAHILAGTVNQASSRTAWIVFPYLMLFLPLAYAFFGVFTWWQATPRMNGTQYWEGPLRIRSSLIGVMVLDLLGIGLEVLYLILHGDPGIMMRELLYIFLHFPHILCVVVCGRHYDRTFSKVTVEE